MRYLSELGERTGSALGLATARGALDQLGQQPDRRPQPARGLGGPLGRGQGVLVPAEPVVADRAAQVVGDQPEPFAAAQHVLPPLLDERQRRSVPSPPVLQHDRGAQHQGTAGGLDDSVRLGGQGHSRLGPAGEQLHEHAVGERERQRGERAGPARDIEMARGEFVPRLVVGQRPGDTAGQPQPAQLVLPSSTPTARRTCSTPASPPTTSPTTSARGQRSCKTPAATPRASQSSGLQVLPDILRYDRTQPATYPNGRIPTDDVYSLRFAWLTNGKVPPSGLKPHTDLLSEFPYLGSPNP